MELYLWPHFLCKWVLALQRWHHYSLSKLSLIYKCIKIISSSTLFFYCKSSIRPPQGAYFFPSTFEGGLIERGGLLERRCLFERGGLIEDLQYLLNSFILRNSQTNSKFHYLWHAKNKQWMWKYQLLHTSRFNLNGQTADYSVHRPKS